MPIQHHNRFSFLFRSPPLFLPSSSFLPLLHPSSSSFFFLSPTLFFFTSSSSSLRRSIDFSFFSFLSLSSSLRLFPFPALNELFTKCRCLSWSGFFTNLNTLVDASNRTAQNNTNLFSSDIPFFFQLPRICFFRVSPSPIVLESADRPSAPRSYTSVIKKKKKKSRQGHTNLAKRSSFESHTQLLAYAKSNKKK